MYYHCLISGPRLNPKPDPRARAVLQRAGLRAVARHARRQPELARVQRQHLPGDRPLGDARADHESLPLLQGGHTRALLPQTRRDHRAGRRLDRGPREGRFREADGEKQRGKTIARVEPREFPEDLPAAEGEAGEFVAARLREKRGRRGGKGEGRG